MSSFAQWFPAPENRAAWLAVRRVVKDVCSTRRQRDCNPLMLHGPAGTGKSHLTSALIADAIKRKPDLTATVLAASDLRVREQANEELTPLPLLTQARDADVLLVEDMQHMPGPALEAMVQTIDHRLARQRQTIFTANAGPGQLRHLPARLTSRLASGLVVGLVPLSPPTRLNFLHWRSEQRQMSVPAGVLQWLAQNVGGSIRLLDGALTRLEMLARVHGTALNVDTVAEAFTQDADGRRPTVESITQRVGHYFQVEPRQLRTRDRSRNVLWPRQVGMYLARSLTALSLEQIGAYFGGRDHTTVLHACRKVEELLNQNEAASGVVRQLHAELE